MYTGRFCKVFGLGLALLFLILVAGSVRQVGVAADEQVACTATASRDNSTVSTIHKASHELVTRAERPTVWIVCPIGCQFGQIQAAIDVAQSGDFILAGPGIYSENLTISKSLTLQVVIDNLALTSNRGCGGIEIFGDKVRTSITKVQITDNLLTGLSVSGAARVRILNNIIRGNGLFGIFARPTNIAECRGNTVVDNGTNFSSPDLQKQCS